MIVKRALFTISLLIAFALPLECMGDSCVVTASSGSDVGSLKYASIRCNDTITFDVHTVTVDGTIKLMKSGVTIDGMIGNTPVTILSANFNDPIFSILTPDITIENLAITHDGGISCIETTSMNGLFQDLELVNCKTGISVDGAFALSNKIFHNVYIDVAKPIELSSNANMNIKAPTNLTAHWIDTKSWQLTGANATDKTQIVEVYQQIDASGASDNLVPISNYTDGSGNFDLTAAEFEIAMQWGSTHVNQPGYAYRVLYIDSLGNTSEMSDEFVPADQLKDELPQKMAACEDADWFWMSGMEGHSDEDGLKNGSEDKNQNCVVDDDETSPTNSDTDADGANDKADNCPVTFNPDQKDSDGDNVGDACDDDTPDDPPDDPEDDPSDDPDDDDSSDGNDEDNPSDGDDDSGSVTDEDEDAPPSQNPAGDSTSGAPTTRSSHGGCSILNSTSSGAPHQTLISLLSILAPLASLWIGKVRRKRSHPRR